MTSAIVKLVLKLLFGFTTEQWEAAITKVCDLAEDLGHANNDARATAFIQWFATKFTPTQRTWMIETLRNLAVAFAHKKEWIA